MISRERKWLFIIILLLLFTGFPSGKYIFSDSRNNNNEIGASERRPVIGTRGLGLSRAFITSADDATSPLWNPAGLASLNHGNLIYDFSQGAFSIAYPIKPLGTFGVNLLDLNASDRFLVNHTANPIGTFEFGYNQALLSYARKFGPVQLGVSTGYSRAPNPNSLWAPNYDAGTLVTLAPYAIVGMQLRDIRGVSIQDENGTLLKTFDPQFAFGTTLIPHQFVRWHTGFNAAQPGFGTSLEIVTGSLSANVGSHFSFHTGKPAQSWSLGLSFKQWGKQTYYAFLNEDNLGYKHLLSIGITFGETQHKPEKPKIKKVEPTSNSTQKKSVQQIAKKHNISIELMLAIIYVESKFNPMAVSKTGAGGLMQMMPGTAKEYGLKVPTYSNKLKPNFDRKVDERFDAEKNLNAGLRYFNYLLEKYLNNLTLALGAYNVGPGKVRIRGPLVGRGKKYTQMVLNRRDLYQSNAELLQIDMERLEIILKN
ncbi:hypothetical protein C6501_19655 [Candidatus Poribacteria bacterium]|nr:MAG: hypothetical protein C6501_19655 [Candidatus Poribacteria bacterium]